MNKEIKNGLIGNILEWYDYSLYLYFSSVIAKLFFVETNYLATFGIFAVGFLMRPLGAYYFGHLGDRWGRKKALFLSVLLIALPTVVIGLLPTYSTIGILAPLLLTTLRLIQGFSVGGEYPSSISYLIEHSHKNKKGFTGSLALMGAGIGWLLGSWVSAMISSVCTSEQLLSWGWRIPFLLGSVSGLYALHIRNQAQETATFNNMQRSENPIKELSAAPLLHVVGLNVLPTIAGYLLLAFLPTWQSRYMGMELSDALWLNTYALLLNVTLIPLCGMLSDRFGSSILLTIGATGFVTLSYPLFLLLSGGFGPSFIAMTLFVILLTLSNAPLPAKMAELFPPRIRTTGVALSYNTAVSLFAGTCPLLMTWIIQTTGTPYAPGVYLAIAATTSLMTVLYFAERTKSLKQYVG